MPSHPSDVQQLVDAMQRRLATRARVAERLLLLGTDGIPREVDLMIEWTAGARPAGVRTGGAHPVRIAIEYHDGARPASRTWIIERRAKYRALPVDRLVAVARCGFTSAARASAATHGICALTPAEARQADWVELCERGGAVG